MSETPADLTLVNPATTGSLYDQPGSGFTFAKPMVSTKQVPMGTRLFIVSIMLVILAITSYLFFYRTDNVAVSYAKNYQNLFYQPSS